MNINTIKKLGYQLTGLKIKTNQKEYTHFVYKNEKALYININTQQLKEYYNIKYYTYIRLGILEKDIYIQALLHEIGHFRHHQHIKRNKRHYDNFNYKYYYAEKVAQRYSLRYYKLFVNS